VPRIYTCFLCGERGTKKDATVVVSRFTGRAYCADTKACAVRVAAREALEARKEDAA